MQHLHGEDFVTAELHEGWMFDNVDYWLLFYNLMNKASDKTTYLATRLLAYWYSNQKMSLAGLCLQSILSR